jgi:large subunit ribosomal protein L20
MPRSVNVIASKLRRKKILKLSKGFYGARSNVYSVSKNAVEKSFQYAYVGRKHKKRNFRSLWIQRINSVSRIYGLSYSQLINKLDKARIKLNRKVLSDLAVYHTTVFKELINQITK